MDLEILKKKISTFKGEGGRVSITDDQLLLEVLAAWEQWTGAASGFYSAIGVSSKGIASIIGRAKKLRREGFPAGDFREVKVASSTIQSSGPCTGIELCFGEGSIIRFPEVETLLAFLKKAA